MFSRVCFIVNILVYAYQATTSYEQINAAICLAPVQDGHQFYRIFTSEFTHGNPAHILMNMTTLLAFGVSVEKMYGTAFYAMLNFWLMVLSNGLTLVWSWFMVNIVP